MNKPQYYLILFVSMFFTPWTLAHESDLFDFDINELLEQEVTLASRTPQSVLKTPSAAYVITHQDIKYSGATSIPEALRMVPGVTVGQIDGNKWSVGIRGETARYNNTLQVLVDGRSVYTPLFSGVYWEQLDLVLEDIDRIEVIRGPGASLWGSNAVNGVINIVTKSTRETQGVYSSVTYSSLEEIASLRYGFDLNKDFSGRVYAKYKEHDGLENLNESFSDNDAHMWQGGFRIDGALDKGGVVTLQGDIYERTMSDLFPIVIVEPPYIAFTDDTQGKGLNLMGKWQQPLSLTSDLAIQSYYDRFERQQGAFFTEEHETFNFDLQHTKAWQNHQIVWGVGLQHQSVQLENRRLIPVNGTIGYMESTEDFDYLLVSGFIQDEITLIRDTLSLTLGSKFEHNDLSGYEVQPSARLGWQLDALTTVWASVSRAVRTPSVVEQDLAFQVATLPPLSEFNPSPLPLLVSYDALGRENKAEDLLAYELGWRSWLNKDLLLELTGYYYQYDDAISLVPADPSDIEVVAAVPTWATVSLGTDNASDSYDVYGFEASVDWLVSDEWRVSAFYSYVHSNQKAAETTSLAYGGTPEHSVSLRSMSRVSDHVYFNAWLRYESTKEIYAVDATRTSQSIDSYWDFDMGFIWKYSEQLTASIYGRNLLSSRHQETASEFASPTSYAKPRSVLAQLEYYF